MKEVIFLDMDGVLNNVFFFITKEPENKQDQLRNNYQFMKKHVDPQNMKVLKYILEQLPNVEVIISSSWGAHFKKSLFNKLFKAFKIDKRVIDITPRKLSSERCHEIKFSLFNYEEAGKPITKWLALDDHGIFYSKEYESNEYKVDSYVGLTYIDAVKIIKHFKPEWKPTEIWL